VNDPATIPSPFIYSRRTQVAETLDNELQTKAPSSNEIQLDQQPVALSRPSSRRPAIVGASFALVVIGAAAYDLPKFDVVLPNFPSFAEPSPSKTAAPIPDPAVGATLKEIQSTQQQNAAAVQESGVFLKQNTAILQQGAATLESLKQGLTAQQTTLKSISNQVSSLIARVDSLQNAVIPLTTSSIPQLNARARSVGTSRKKTSRLPEPVGPVSVGGAPLNSAPGAG
jgi:uncharacterized coiled-coil protein SlyX